MSEIITLKILLLGDSSTRKTEFLLKFTQDCFPEDHLSTIGVDYHFKFIKINDIRIKLEIWDTAGQERFQSLNKNYFRNADGIILLYDISNKATFNSLKNHLHEIEEEKKDIKIIIVGNNIDLEKEREISRETVKEFCEKKNI